MQVDYLDLTDDFRHEPIIFIKPHWKIDGHLTPLGHELVAQAIYRKLQQDIFVANP